MEENNQAVNDVVESLLAEDDDSVSDSAPDDQDGSADDASDGDDAVATAAEESQDDAPGDEGIDLSPKAQKRIRRLVEEKKRLQAQMDEMTIGMYGSPDMAQPSPTGQTGTLPWEGESIPSEITVEDYQRDVLTQADKIVQARLQQERSRMQLKEDVTKIEQEYPELNPDSDEFDHDLDRMIVKNFVKVRKADPRVTAYEFVKEVMSLRDKGEAKGRATTTAKLVEQAAGQAVSPGRGKTPSKDYDKQALYERALESGDNEDWAAYFDQTVSPPK